MNFTNLSTNKGSIVERSQLIFFGHENQYNTLTSFPQFSVGMRPSQSPFEMSLTSLWMIGVIKWFIVLSSTGVIPPTRCQSASQLSAHPSVSHIPHHGRCERITMPFCHDIRYNETIMPNLLNHQKQDDAAVEVHQFSPLVKVVCSPDLQFFLCTVYAPVCTILEKPIPPCRSLCESARSGCEQLMNKFGFPWPEVLECSKFPELQGEDLCVGEPNDHYASHRNVPDGYSFTPTPPSSRNKLKNRNVTRNVGFTCPLQFQTPPGLDYVLRIQGKDYSNCGAPCDGFPLSGHDKNNLRLWIGIWSLTCVLSCLFTVLTFTIDRHRFKYPERPIIFLSLCYMCIGVVYVVGFFLGDRVACNEPFPSPFGSEPSTTLQMISTVTQGNKKESCTLLFMILYFFTISSAIWWVILTLTWFLAAGLKWGHEAIESNSHFYHLAGWAVPAVMTIAVLALGKMEGDVLSGVCFIGYWNQESNSLFVFIPVIICLATGQIFLFAGFMSLWKIRTVMKTEGTKTSKLDKLMARIALFSVLYICPMVLLLLCHYYERMHLNSWVLSWQQDICMKPEYSIPCPLINPSDKPSRPNFSIFFLKYSMVVLAGITSGFWVWSEKTLTSWANFYRKISSTICCSDTNQSVDNQELPHQGAQYV